MRSEYIDSYSSAIRVCDVEGAIKAAKGLQEAEQSLADFSPSYALDLVVLMFQQRDRRAEKYGHAWIELLEAKGCKLPEAQIAAAAMQGLKDHEIAFRCEKVLKILANRIWP